MIIIEGCDGSGKTTLASDLLKHGVVDKCLESPRRTKRENETLANATYRCLDFNTHNRGICVDRLIFSELVYGPLLRQRVEWNHFDTVNLIKRSISLPNITVFCIVNPDEIRFKPDENPDVVEKAEILVKDYMDWLRLVRSLSMNNNVFHYRWTTEGSLERLIHTWSSRGLI